MCSGSISTTLVPPFSEKRALSGVPTTEGNVIRLSPETAFTALYSMSKPTVHWAYLLV